MKTNLLKITMAVRVPEEWDAAKCKSLRAVTGDDRPGPIDVAVESSLADLSAKLAAIDSAIEITSEVQR